MDLSTSYLGLELPHPFVAGASPMVDHLDMVRRLEDAGAAAIIMHSLFEEQIVHQEAGVAAHMESHGDAFAEATSYFPPTEFNLGPEQYLTQIQKIKRAVDVPLIASLNGINEGTWVEYARLIEEAGADALELNLYVIPTQRDDSSAVVEQRLFQIVRLVRQTLSIPVSVKLSPYFTALTHFAARMEDAGVNGLVLFNRFYQPDIDIEELEMRPSLRLSESSELRLRLRWLATLFGRVDLDFAVTGGVHTAEDAVKATMAGASAIQMVSALLRHGPEYLRSLRQDYETWLLEHEYTSVREMQGNMSHRFNPNPEALERSNYIKILQSWQPY